MKIADNTYRITISGNGYTSGALAEEHFLRRASEITAENGMSKFVVIDGDLSIRQATSYNPGTTRSTATIDTVAPTVIGSQSVSVQTTHTPATVTQVNRPTFVGTILIFDEMGNSDLAGLRVYDAQIILSNYLQ